MPATPVPISPDTPERFVQDTQVKTVTFAGRGVLLDEYEKLAQAFQEIHPDVRIQVIDVEDVVDFAKGDQQNWDWQVASAADVAIWNPSLEASQRGWILDLQPSIDRDTGFDLHDFYPHTLDSVQWEGGTWGIPESASLVMIYYDKNAFDEAGVPYPEPGWTYDDLLSTAQRVTVQEQERVLRYGLVNLDPWKGTRAFVEGWAGPLPAGTELTLLDLTAPSVQDAVRWYTDLSLKYGVMPRPAELAAPTDPQQALWDLVEEGRAAMWINPVGSQLKTNLNLGVVPFPTGRFTTNPGHVQSYIISSGTAYPQESWRWVDFLTRHWIVDRFGQVANEIPGRQSVAENLGYWAQWEDDVAESLRFAMAHARMTPGGECASALKAAVDSMLAGESAAEALAKAQETMIGAVDAYEAALATPRPLATRQTAGSAAQTTITFAPTGPDTAVYRELAAIFHERQSEIRVQIVSPNQVDSADCFASSGLAGGATPLNLQPLLDMDPSFTLDDFYPHALDAFRQQGSLWGVPIYAQPKVVFYNRDVLDRAGVAYPEPGWTLDDLVEKAKALTRTEGEEKVYGFMPLNGDARDLPLFVALQGAQLWQVDDPTQVQLDAPNVVQAVEWYTDLALEHSVMPIFPEDLPGPDPEAQERREALVAQGRVAMWTDFAVPGRLSLDGVRYSVAPMPQGRTKATQFMHGGVSISAKTVHREACWEWLKFVSEHAILQNALPARRSVAASAAWRTWMGEEAAAAYLASAEYSDTLSMLGNTRALNSLYAAVADIYAGLAPDVALGNAQRRVE